MKNKMKKYLRPMLGLMIAILVHLTQKTKYTKYEFDGKDFDVEYVQYGRWYSPFWWIFLLIFLVPMRI